ncbi:transcriptional regulator [Desulfosporosinus orientis DSM 765]|uniref:Transcriptional regulator n=1 Tax=Desulfosporosinus orientis (strain ATCC 19365 / DSM 765 / NCIMB 8382 / VKM B-1628 / Singapore I) TaxID=768706 RepID=G7WB00_DESOD|nr:IclR family transcriptional regulator [Desulfosporosinus orientis]AET67501.1 transcriptional regulator [Desulfosporosinus orientis DSM 765]
MEPEVKVKSLQKALEVLNCFTEKQPLGVTEISEKLGLYKSNVHNILMTFTAMEYLIQDEESGKFRLGSRVITLSRALGDSYDILRLATPFMNKFTDLFNEIVYLAIPHKDEVIYLGAAYPGNYHKMGLQNVQGDCAPMHCTGVGKAILSSLPDEFIEEYMSQQMIRMTEYTITEPELLRNEIKRIREKGYAVDNMELSIGITCVGVPILDRKNKLVGAWSVSGPSPRMNQERIMEIQLQLKQSANELKVLL